MANQEKSLDKNLDQYKVKPNSKFSLSSIQPNDKSERSDSKAKDALALEKLAVEINALQDILHAQAKHKVLLILQGMDASGKDGTVKHVFSECDPLGIRLASFKAPSADELAHDYLWRVHSQVPKKGEIVIFNRSHYEDVLIVKVHDWIDEAECKRRFTQINDFERMLTETGTLVIKCFLHISKEEQKVRMEERLDDPTKTWKFNPGDLNERAVWSKYMVAYENALQATSTSYAPWYVVPADSKTNRNLLISRLLLNALKSLKLAYPPVPAEYKKISIED
ncbi:polyphosphate kinase 2 family protein [Methylotenera sp. N17]|jgi:PPK2 family polyphosphate:nucleotide phosphotransferase|uniref:polyphosphate kinase 2 family protein n=1 Tax=Methylotenera sp. N17 TaxID=1502761 RepID=UPI0006479F3C|nr:polyphosphate kinase 2 family protein [Methylotenera sp. N17]